MTPEDVNAILATRRTPVIVDMHEQTISVCAEYADDPRLPALIQMAARWLASKPEPRWWRIGDGPRTRMKSVGFDFP